MLLCVLGRAFLISLGLWRGPSRLGVAGVLTCVITKVVREPHVLGPGLCFCVFEPRESSSKPAIPHDVRIGEDGGGERGVAEPRC